ncbi:origin recognition complex subunit 3 N-terminus-domain-containing protein [Kalaharituber pfeilii]|nr:origin recognition complex subunit 3 N-terminus-domain-containing protein [Kalaharituber pfeilii]
MSTVVQEPHATDYDPQEHFGCYIFTPQAANGTRGPKRRRTSGSKPGKHKGKAAETKGLNVSDDTEQQCLFPQLFDEKESLEAVKLRWDSYHRLWVEQEKRTNNILASVNEKTLGEVSGFVRRATRELYDGKLPTAIILAGPNIASHGPLFCQLATRIQTNEHIGPVVLLSSKDATNLKGVLRKLIKDATQDVQGFDDEEDLGTSEKKLQSSTKFLNYDLQILQNWWKDHQDLKVTIAIQDTEAFDSGILSDLVLILSACLDRIPFVLLLGVATSIEIFHEKLPKSIIRLMRGEKFDVERAEECLAKIFNDATIGTKSVLRLGPLLSEFLLKRQRDHTQSIQAFVAALKYAYMSHFYANPLSILLAFLHDPSGLDEVLQSEHIEAVRNLSSFRRFVEGKLKENDTYEVRALLDDDKYLHSIIATSCAECQSYMQNLAQALEVLEVARSCMSNQSNRVTRHELYPKALLGELDGSPLIRELLLTIKKMNSTKLLTLLDKLISIDIPYLQDLLIPLRDEISDLIEDSENKNLNSEFDLSAADTMRATVVSKRVQLSEKRSTLTKEEEEYSRLIQEVHDVMERFLGMNLKGLDGVLLHEAFFYDLLSPHRDVFAPRSRFAIERALSRPHDYLGCGCCVDQNGTQNAVQSILPSMPPTSILYKLYLESGPLINTYDLWCAFYSIMSNNIEDGEGEEEGLDQQTAQALFYQGLAELKFLGFIKHSKKKTDHLAKLAWKGL